MLNIYRSRENIDKEKFIYEHIDPKIRTIVIVPDQYTLTAEKQAMDRLGKEVLLDIEITGISRLGSRLLEETGGAVGTVINRYGRHMLISKILGELNEEFLAFGGFGNKETFVDAINNFISSAKQHQFTRESLEMLSAKAQTDGAQALLARKLHDLSLIFSKYQEMLGDKYSDNEDMLELYTRAISKSNIIERSSIWIYNFDSYTPKNMRFIIELAKYGADVNIYLNYDENCYDEDLFVLTGQITETFENLAREEGIKTKITNIADKELQVDRVPGIKYIEKNLFAIAPQKTEDSQGVRVTECSNIYSEIEAAAQHVLYLLREKKYRLSDIVLICNDQEYRGPIIDRVFKEYGLNIFDDKKRRVISSPIAVYALSLLQIVVENYRTTDVMRFLKSGLTGICDADIEELENYVIKYSIKGNMWRKPFERGSHEAVYQDGALERIESIREELVGQVGELEELLQNSSTYRDFALNYRDFLLNKGMLSEELADKQRAEGLTDLAEETEQIIEDLGEILLQMAEIMGEEPFDGTNFVRLFKSGLSQMQVGVIPPTNDDIMLGTMQRTRSGDIKALLVIGANDNMIPRVGGEDALFSREELETLTDEGQNLGLSSELKLMEENLAIYRNLAKPSEELWVSYASVDQEANELRPSVIVGYIESLFYDLEIEGDPSDSDSVDAHIGGYVNTLRHYTEAMRRVGAGQDIPTEWNIVQDWLRDRDGDFLDRVDLALEFDNVQDPLEETTASGLYASYMDKDGDPVYRHSPTGLEKYSRCPFAFFVDRGLRAQELRMDEVGGREIGDLYHSVLQELTEEIARDNSWDTVTKEEVSARVEDIAQKWAKEYRSDLFDKGQAEGYRLRRAIEASQSIAWAVVVQAREGKIKDSLFEVPFGIANNNDTDKTQISFAPIVKELSNGKAYIQGKIDRVDLLEDDRVKIIDYKTGAEYFDIDEVKAGYRLQLMIYLQAAQENRREPAGVFYFLIKEPELRLKEGEDLNIEEIDKKTIESYRMDGILIDDEAVIREIAGDFDEKSQVLKLKRNKNGSFDKYSGKRVLSEGDFKELQQAVDRITQDICQDISTGKIDLTPKVTHKRAECKYCGYHGICRFDSIFKGCKYDVVS